MAKMTMTYNTNMESETIVDWLWRRGTVHNLFPINGDNKYGRGYRPINHDVEITVRDNKQVQISDVKGKGRNIRRAKSKLLKSVEGLKLS